MKENMDNDNSNEFANLSETKPHEKIQNKNQTSKNLISKEKEPKIYPKKYNYICQKKRNTYMIIVDKNGVPIITVGPNWIFFSILFIFINCGFLFLFIGYYQYIPLYLFISGIIIYFIFIFVYTKLFITNPGFAENIQERKDDEFYLYCKLCDIYVNKKSKTAHCSKCGLCIEEFNHHCDWIGKCIGKKNLYQFYFIIFWICIIILYYTGAFLIAHENWFEHEKLLRKIEKMKMNQK